MFAIKVIVLFLCVQTDFANLAILTSMRAFIFQIPRQKTEATFYQALSSNEELLK